MMRRIGQCAILAVLCVVCMNCEKHPSNPPVPVAVSADFFQSWTRSYEEEAVPSDGIQIYRPSDSRDFPPARFRNRYVFDRDGTSEWLVLHPTDAHYMEPATWEADADDPMVISIYNPVGTEVVRFEILDLAPDLMRIESLKYEVPRCNYLYGKVDVHFQRHVGFEDVDAFVRGLDLEHIYFSKGLVQVRVEVISGDPLQLKNQLLESESVERVTHSTQSFPEHRDFLIVTFVAAIGVAEAPRFFDAYSDLRVLSTRKNAAWARFEVPVGEEDDWVTTFRNEPLVDASRKAGAFCP